MENNSAVEPILPYHKPIQGELTVRSQLHHKLPFYGIAISKGPHAGLINFRDSLEVGFYTAYTVTSRSLDCNRRDRLVRNDGLFGVVFRLEAFKRNRSELEELKSDGIECARDRCFGSAAGAAADGDNAVGERQRTLSREQWCALCSREHERLSTHRVTTRKASCGGGQGESVLFVCFTRVLFTLCWVTQRACVQRCVCNIYITRNLVDVLYNASA